MTTYEKSANSLGSRFGTGVLENSRGLPTTISQFLSFLFRLAFNSTTLITCSLFNNVGSFRKEQSLSSSAEVAIVLRATARWFSVSSTAGINVGAAGRRGG